MTHRWQRQGKLPVDQPPRIEIRVRKGFHDRQRNIYEEDDSVVCNCFPRTSDHTIPSMYYDKLSCPHHRKAHIQPAQEEHFDYPWTPNSIPGHAGPQIDDDLSERLSLMSGEDEQLRFSPGLIDRRPGDVVSVATAPPYWYEQETDPRAQDAPNTAPADYAVLPPNSPLGKPKRALSMRDLQNPNYRDDEYPTNRRAMTQNGQNSRMSNMQRNSRLSNRQFTGNYVDPKDGRVYRYNVNYDGTPQPKGSREPVNRQSPTRQPQSRDVNRQSPAKPPEKPMTAQ